MKLCSVIAAVLTQEISFKSLIHSENFETVRCTYVIDLLLQKKENSLHLLLSDFWKVMCTSIIQLNSQVC